MLQNAYLLAKIGADTAENERNFAEILLIGRRVADSRAHRHAKGTLPIFGKFSAKFRSFSAVSAPIFATKYAFCSIFQNLPDYVTEIFEVWQIFCKINLNLQNCQISKLQLENLVDLNKCGKTRIYLQRSVPIQPKTSEMLPKFCQKLATTPARPTDVRAAAPSVPASLGGPSRPSTATHATRPAAAVLEEAAAAAAKPTTAAANASERSDHPDLLPMFGRC